MLDQIKIKLSLGKNEMIFNSENNVIYPKVRFYKFQIWKIYIISLLENIIKNICSFLDYY
jgi:hypothetical protein